MNSQELAELFTPSQAVVISNEQGGGEEDTSHIDWAPLSLKHGSTSKSSPASSSITTKDSPASKASHNSSSKSTRSSGSSQKNTKYRFRLPVVSEKGTLEEEGEGEDNVRSNSPVIRAYLEERVNTANEEITSVDSLRKFCEEGSEDSEVDSLSSAYSDLNNDFEEVYTLERLRAAGPPLSSLAPLLEDVLDSRGDRNARHNSSDVLLTSQTPQED